MEFWLSGEVSDKIGDEYRAARTHVEEMINRSLSNREYGPISEFSFIGIIMERNDVGWEEIAEFRRGEAEFRLKIPFKEFRDADSEAGRARMVLMAVHRAAEMLQGMKSAEKVKSKQLALDILAVGKAEGLMP